MKSKKSGLKLSKYKRKQMLKDTQSKTTAVANRNLKDIEKVMEEK